MPNTFNNMKTYFAIIFSVCMLGGCVRAVSMPVAVDSKTSAIAITIDQRYTRHSGFLYLDSSSYLIHFKNIYFIKLKDKDDSLDQSDIVTSNYSNRDFFGPFNTYLLNVEPGYYAAVGAMEGHVYIYFPEDIVKASIVEVKPNTMVYMGHFELQSISNLDKKYAADELQNFYYSNMVFPGHKNVHGKAAITNMQLPQFHAPKVKTILKSEALEKHFLSDHLEIFGDSEWKHRIQNRIDELQEK